MLFFDILRQLFRRKQSTRTLPVLVMRPNPVIERFDQTCIFVFKQDNFAGPLSLTCKTCDQQKEHASAEVCKMRKRYRTLVTLYRMNPLSITQEEVQRAQTLILEGHKPWPTRL